MRCLLVNINDGSQVTLPSSKLKVYEKLKDKKTDKKSEDRSENTTRYDDNILLVLDAVIECL